MTDAELFDLVAPIAICHRADLLYERKALAACRKLRKLKPENYKGTDCQPPATFRLDDLDCWATALYDSLFWSLVESQRPNWTWEFDRYGAKAVLDEQGREVFSGDSSWCFPWYETAELVIQRLAVHEEFIGV